MDNGSDHDGQDWFTLGLVLILLIVFGGGGVLLVRCEPEPSPCVDTITLVSAIPGNPSATSCHPDQEMSTENKMQGVVVKCTCRKVSR